MLSPSSLHRLRSFRSGLPQMLVLALSLAIGACDSTEGPLNPTEDPLAPATEPAPPTWSPDGSKIAFTSSRSGIYQVWTVSATGGTPTRITHTSTSERDPAWSH